MNNLVWASMCSAKACTECAASTKAPRAKHPTWTQRNAHMLQHVQRTHMRTHPNMQPRQCAVNEICTVQPQKTMTSNECAA
eukprot:945488-Prorocentrum_lima.AAC.1